MPRGLAGVRKAAAELEARRASGPGAGALWLRLPKSGDEAVVRFLEEGDDVFYAEMHEVPMGGTWPSGKPKTMDIPCLKNDDPSADCPGCNHGNEDVSKTKFKGFINVIWFDAPKFKRDDNNKIVKDKSGNAEVVGEEDQVAIWSSGIRLFEELDEHNATYKGLMSRPFKIKRKGTGLDTKYVIAPDDADAGPVAMSKTEKKLADDKYDLNPFVKPPDYDEFVKKLSGDFTGGDSESSDSGGSSSSAAVNPFLRNRSK